MGDQTAQVQPSVAALGSLESVLDGGVVGELAILDDFVDLDNILPDDTAGTDVQVTDFRVAHQAIGQANGVGGSLELNELGLVLGEGVHDGCLGGSDGVAILG